MQPACLVALRLNVQGKGFVQVKVEVPQILVILTLGKGMTCKRYVKIISSLILRVGFVINAEHWYLFATLLN